MSSKFEEFGESLRQAQFVKSAVSAVSGLGDRHLVDEDDIVVKEKERDYILARRKSRRDFEIEESARKKTRYGEIYEPISDDERPKLGLIYKVLDRPPSRVMTEIMAALDELEIESAEGGTDDWQAGTDSKIGLALSGGGIRSSSFCLGAIQVLLKYQIFQNIDYLSTVSGGGYIGSAFSSLYSGHKHNFNFAHEKGEPEPAPFRYLRNHANYLLPDGMIDIFRMIAVILRGLLVNIAILGSIMVLVAAGVTALMDNYEAFWVTGYGEYYEAVFKLPLTGATLALMAITMLLMTAAMKPFWSNLLGKKSGPRREANWAVRNSMEKTLAGMLAAAVFVALLEGHLLLIQWLAVKIQDQQISGITGLIGLAPLLVRMIPAKILHQVKGLAGRFVMIAIGFIGVAIFAGLYFGLAAVMKSGQTLAFTGLNLEDLVMGAALVLLATYWFADINRTSLHNYYRDRLSKAFLFRFVFRQGERQDNVVHEDQVALSRLQGSTGPYHLVNATLNLKRADESYRKGRRADFFLFSPYYIGSKATKYCETRAMESVKPHVNLGTAMAISGAAAAPNAGRHMNPLLTFLLAATNVRLNYWLPNPSHVAPRKNWVLKQSANVWNFVSQRFTAGPWYLLREMVGQVESDGLLVNVSDGGHIENMGLYQLLKRRCNLIILCDGEHDAKMQFGGLLEAVRIAQIDLGIRITFDGLDEIRLGRQSHAVGTIHYKDGVDENGNPKPCIGRLLYLKSSLEGDSGLQDSLGPDQFASSQFRHDREIYDAYSYIAQYRATHPDFPHETTGDQFFDEQQFECYRALGYIVAESAIADRPDAPRHILRGTQQ